MQDRNDLERVSIGFATMFGIYWLYKLFLSPFLNLSPFREQVVGMLLLYGLGLLLFVRIAGCSFRFRMKRRHVTLSAVIPAYLLEFSALVVVSLILNLSSVLGIRAPSPTDYTPGMLFLLLLFAPVVEEMVFRHLVASVLFRHGERSYVLASAISFAIVHSVATGLAQVVYTFILGLVWASLYVKTGRLPLVILLHALSNLHPVLLRMSADASPMLASAVVFAYGVFGFAGIVLYLVRRKNIRLDGEVGLLRKETLRAVLANRGFLFFLGLTVVMVLSKTLGFGA